MKIILDTNVIIAAFSSHGLCFLIFELCLDKYKIIISNHILNEIEKNFNKKIKLHAERISEIIDYLKSHCLLCNYQKLKKSVCRDKDDDEILALGKYNDVKYIITGDKDLLILKEYEKIKIVTPRDFWELSKKE